MSERKSRATVDPPIAYYYEIVKPDKPGQIARLYPIAAGTLFPCGEDSWVQRIEGKLVTKLSNEEVGVLMDKDGNSVVPK